MPPKVRIVPSAVPLSPSVQSLFRILCLPALLLLTPFFFSCDRIHTYLHPNEGKIGFIDHQGKFVIQPRYQWIQGFKGGVAAVEVRTPHINADGSQYDEEGKFGAVNTRGDLIVPLEYRTVRALGDGFIMAQNDKGWFLFDENGKSLCPGPFEQQFTESGNGLVGYRFMRKDGSPEYGFLDKSCNHLYTTVYLHNRDIPARVYTERFGEGLVWASDKHGPILVDLEGKVAARFTSARVTLCDRRPFAEGFSAVATAWIKGGEHKWDYTNWGYVNTKCELIVPGLYDEAHDFSDGLACVRKGEFYGFVDAGGREAISPQFFNVDMDGFQDGFCAVQKVKDGPFFFIDHQGQKVFGREFDEAYAFHEGAAAVRVKDKWGLIDKTGNFVIKPKYVLLGSFHSGLAAAAE